MRPGAALPAPASRTTALATTAASRTRTRRVALATVSLAAGAAALAACGGSSPPEAAPTPGTGPLSGSAAAGTAARAELAGLAAAAEDRRYTALYNLSQPGRPERTVVVTTATDGSWRVDIPGGALGGTADVAVARTADGLFQCGLPSAERPVEGTCVRVAAPDGSLPSRIDPRVQHAFTDWIEALTDRNAPLSVTASAQLPGARGSCFAVESISASLTAPLDVGIYCFAADGMLTAARLELGTLTLAGDPAAAPPSITLPGQVVNAAALGMATPPAPSPSVAASRSGPSPSTASAKPPAAAARPGASAPAS